MPRTESNPIFKYSFTVPTEAVDQNGHVNNVYYVQWMQDVAVRHYDHLGGTKPTLAIGATWVVREHHIRYLNPAFAGDEIEVHTWVANFRRVRSLRCYKFYRKSDNTLLAKGDTDWVFVDIKNGQPMAIPEKISKIFTLYSDTESHPNDEFIVRENK